MQLKNPCPWCGSFEAEEHDNGTVGCARCSAVIPVGVTWYERGDYKPANKWWLS